jgi:hypothetical protein
MDVIDLKPLWVLWTIEGNRQFEEERNERHS